MRSVGAGLWYGGKITGCGAAGNGFRGLHIHYFRSGMHKREKTHGLSQKIQAMYFKIQGTCFKIYALYFSRFQMAD